MIGGSRIPFARADGPYATASNQDMLAAALDGLVERFGLEGERVGEFVAGAVLKHSRDFNLARETVLGSRLDPRTPAYDIQQACGTGLQAVIAAANKIALGAVDCAIAGGADTASDAPLGVNDQLRKILLEARRAKSASTRGSRRSHGCAPGTSSRTSRATPNPAPGSRWVSTRRSPPEPGASAARTRTCWRRPATSGSPPLTNAASSRTWWCPSGAWPATRICVRAPPSANSPG